ncbi:Crp/Fnr family transcriptional regulator [Phenylobacterium sp.]|uniref:Crp/Fnr family transcriptional regulator n=1 Tax=Phenylobacterium sp. TaxID=1871053 RepID=UPI002730D116|nr:Crp/Fnr family transcriptional regulator [Phenylobacterium sp.]MDP1600645.1 Crp/Fnr family transcriptional regulator [Phenylobacterium sp.]MDP3590568.1 Crp/Fnr family transcriptional regulator [Phenylobacterium sp.]
MSYIFVMSEDRDQALRLLGVARWLEAYPPGLAEALVAEGALSRLRAGQWAQAEGDEETGLMVVIEGAVDLFCQAPGDREVRISHAGAGAALGQTMRFGGGPRLVTAVCAEPSLLLRVSDAGLERIARLRPDIWRAVATLVYFQLRNALQMAAEVAALPPRQRLASRLLMLARGREAPVVLNVSQQGLAEMIGLTRKTVNGHLAGLQREGAVRLDYARIWIEDARRLQVVADS